VNSSAGNGAGSVRSGVAAKDREPETEALAFHGDGLGGHMQEILDALPFYVMLIDSSHVIQFANKAVRERFDVTSEQIRGKHCPSFVHGVGHYPGCPVAEAIAGGPTEKTHYAEELGRWLWTTAYPTGVKTRDGLELYFHMVRDVTDEVQAREDLAASERKFRNLFEALEDIAFVMSRKGALQDINRAGLEILQIPSKREALRFNLLTDLTLIDAGWEPFLESLEAMGRVVDHEVSFKQADGQVRTVSITANTVTDESAESGMVRGIMRDLTRHRELEQLSIIDVLTSLYNRGFFMSRLAARIRRIRSGEQSELSVLFMDVDDFKAYNDSYGHQEGDYALKRVAAGVKAALRDEDMAARYGGEEFTVMMSCGPQMAREVAERVRSSVQTRCSVSADPKIQRDITVSVGFAALTPDVCEAEELVSFADARMYEAKQSGRNCVC
jgi:diguanylate cyclase (GGDEF)-like protein/PAS domain S-box-containing protein